MEEVYLKDSIKCLSIVSSEFLLYPISTVITRVQANHINVSVNKRLLSSYHGGMSIFSVVPAFIFRLKFTDVVEPTLKEKCKYLLRQVFRSLYFFHSFLYS